MVHGMLIKFDSKVEGNAVDLYRYHPSIGLKMSKLKSYVADIEQVVGATGIRILAPIPNTSLVGFEVPRKDRKFIETKPTPKGFELSMGVDIMGEDYKFDIRQAPHMLVAGATGLQFLVTLKLQAVRKSRLIMQCATLLYGLVTKFYQNQSLLCL